MITLFSLGNVFYNSIKLSTLIFGLFPIDLLYSKEC